MNTSKKIQEVIDYYKFIYPAKVKNKRINSISPSDIHIFGISRGGTTWLAELLLTIENSVLIWEPLFKYKKYILNNFNPFSYPERHFGMGWHPYIPQGESWEEAELFFNELLSRNILNIKLTRFNEAVKFTNADTYIYKFCFGNLLLPWLVDNYTIKPILLVRHPYAVVASMDKFGDNFISSKKTLKFDATSEKYQDIFLKYQDKFLQIKTPEQRLMTNWLVQYKYLVEHPYNNKKWLTVSYENLFLNPDFEIKRIFRYLNRDIPDTIFDVTKKQSFSSKEDHASAEIAKGIQLQKWNKHFSKEKLIEMNHYLKVVWEIDFYGDGIEPDYNILYK